MTPVVTLAALRRHAIARSLFTPTTLPRAIAKLGFVQADPIRAPAPADAATRRQHQDALVDVIVRKYAPLTAAGLGGLVWRLRAGAPRFAGDLPRTLARAKARLAHARIDGVDWYWPEGERPQSPRHAPDDDVRLLAPFDPIVWDRRRFRLFWGWDYRFEAYTPAPKRKLGYYALPLLWRDDVIGWGNLAVKDGKLASTLGYTTGAPREPAFRRGLDAELERMRVFLRC
jgi:hypothetical protein